MAPYKLTADENVIQRTGDGAFIPVDEANADYRSYLEWLDDGNEPDPAE